MARWKLTEPHYLRVDGIRWEYSEVDRITGRPKRTQFDVPLYINPNYEDDVKQYGQEYQQDRVIIVSDGNNAQPRDLVFLGDPTPSMIPIDREAEEVSKRYVKHWTPPAEGEAGFAKRLEEKLIMQMAEVQAGVRGAPQVEGFSEFAATMTAMMKQQTEILAMLVKVQGDRRRTA